MCWKKEDKIQLKQTGNHITIKWNGQKNFQTIQVLFNGIESDDSDNDDENYNENI